MALLADTEFLNQGAVLGNILFLQILEQITALTNQFQKASAGMVILGMGLKMLGQVLDPVGQSGYNITKHIYNDIIVNKVIYKNN